jgi:UDP-perosamine 4-acetyltransferase
MNKKEIYIIGAGSYGEAIFDLAENCGYKVVGFFDDDLGKKNEKIFDAEVLGPINNLFSENIINKNYAVAIGNNKIRRNILKNIRQGGGNTPSLIHPTAELCLNTKIGQGVYIQPKAVVWTKVIIEDDCIISPLSLICHHSIMKKGSFLSNLSSIGANIIIEENVFIGMGSTIMSGITRIGANSIIGAGSVVIHDVLPNTIVAGNPARVLKNNEK